MAYLLTQILFCLVLAALLGGAVGWIVNGWRAARREEALRVELLKQSLALNQAETDNSMIEDDFRELKYRSEEAVALLREETAQVPVLQQNLEKSQLLVRQLMQKHEAELRQVEHDKNVLVTRNRELENRESAVTKLQADLNQQRLLLSSEQVARDASAAASRLAASDGTASTQSDSTPSDSDNGQDNGPDNGQDNHGPLINNPGNHNPEAHEYTHMSKHHESGTQDSNDRDSNSDINAGYYQSSFFDQAQIDPQQAEDDQDRSTSADDSQQHRNSTAVVETTKESGTVSLAGKLSGQSASWASDRLSGEQSTVALPHTDNFGVTDVNDDLQSIYGIGPVAARTLSSLGITSFEQIARFTRQDIEYIADVLGIFPGRIETDDWVGSARKKISNLTGKTSDQRRSSEADEVGTTVSMTLDED